MDEEQLPELVGYAGTVPRATLHLFGLSRRLQGEAHSSDVRQSGWGGVEPKAPPLAYAISPRLPTAATPPRPRGGRCPVSTSNGYGLSLFAN